jgi:hypothetical protein
MNDEEFQQLCASDAIAGHWAGGDMCCMTPDQGMGKSLERVAPYRAASPELVRRTVLEAASVYPELRGCRVALSAAGTEALVWYAPDHKRGKWAPVRRDTFANLRTDAHALAAKAVAALPKPCPECVVCRGAWPLTCSACGPRNVAAPAFVGLTETPEHRAHRERITREAAARERLDPTQTEISGNHMSVSSAPAGYTFKVDLVGDVRASRDEWYCWYFSPRAQDFQIEVNADGRSLPFGGAWGGHEDARQHAARMIGQVAPPLRTARTGLDVEREIAERTARADAETLPAGWRWEDSSPCVAATIRDGRRIHAGVESSGPNKGFRYWGGEATPEVWAAVEAKARRLGLIKPKTPGESLIGHLMGT